MAKELGEYLGVYKFDDGRTDIELVLAYTDNEAEANLRARTDLKEYEYGLRIYKRIR